MKILVAHRIPFTKVRYDRCINHSDHDVTYFGTPAALATIPADIRCRRIERPDNLDGGDWAPLLKGASFDRAVALSEYDLAATAQIREGLSIRGARSHEVAPFRDKMLMKTLVAKAGVRVPRFLSLSKLLQDTAEVAPWLNGPLVLKPVDGASSENVVLFESGRQLFAALRLRSTGIEELDAEDRRADRYEVEEYIAGPILHIDGFAAAGVVRGLIPSRYVNTCLDYARGKPLGSYQEELTPELEAFARRALAAVGIREGAVHLEAILSPDGPVFLEVANRCGGAEVVSTYEMATGVNLYHAHIQATLGLEVAAAPAGDRSGFFGWFVFPGHHLPAGRCAVSCPPLPVRADALVRWVEIDRGRPLPRKITYQLGDVPLGGIARGDSPSEVGDLFRRIFASVEIYSTEPTVEADAS